MEDNNEERREISDIIAKKYPGLVFGLIAGKKVRLDHNIKEEDVQHYLALEQNKFQNLAFSIPTAIGITSAGLYSIKRKYKALSTPVLLFGGWVGAFILGSLMTKTLNRSYNREEDLILKRYQNLLNDDEVMGKVYDALG